MSGIEREPIRCLTASKDVMLELKSCIILTFSLPEFIQNTASPERRSRFMYLVSFQRLLQQTLFVTIENNRFWKLNRSQ